MPSLHDGPRSPLYRPLMIQGQVAPGDLPLAGVSEEMAQAAAHVLSGECTCWGIPFRIDRLVLLRDRPITLNLDPLRTGWLVFMHTADLKPLPKDEHGFISPMRGQGHLGETAAEYVVLYEDGSEERLPVRRRFEIGAFQRIWGENCFCAVAHIKPSPVREHHEQPAASWGRSQTRVELRDAGLWVNWLWAWQNPHPQKAIVGLRLEPKDGTVLLSAISAGEASRQPLRWDPRRKALLTLPEGTPFDPYLDEFGRLAQIQLDLGQVISAQPRPLYPDEGWAESYNNQLPELAERQILIEYTAHPDARFHLWDQRMVPVAELQSQGAADALRVIPPATQRVRLRVVEKATGRPVPVKLHIHGSAGEYLPPVDRHRIPNGAWFEDYSVDFLHQGIHYCTYIPGETRVDLPLGPVYIEVSKGFEIRPLRRVVEVRGDTEEIVFEIEKVLPWRERGWVSADTHVHFLSPTSALLEGSGEGVNIVNLLASQWGELMTNVGDFDGKTTWGSKETGGDGEYLVRVGTENRQHVLGHISLLGYEGSIIAPMTTGGPTESAIGDPIETLLTEWARRCHEQKGVVVLPHFPNPRAEHAASITLGDIDAVEMTSWGDLYSGINPYSLSDWYRYLNNGYFTAAVGGTDKMTALTAVGTVRTYAQVAQDQAFTYEAWKEAVRAGRTFVTYGPLLEFAVDGRPMGSRIAMSPSGGTVEVTWRVASVTVP
ncbi:MAG: CehA/McbA family metallohydrolase, partial [Chloroflexi bacterium]|nr:CehA/McbA family metallohydrolase [Chloroflexota bacterium]